MHSTATASAGSAAASAAPRRFARPAAIVIASIGLAALTGCSSSRGTAAPKVTVTVTALASPPPAGSPATPAPPAATVPDSGGSAGSGGPAGPGPCPTRYLRVELGPAQGTAGSAYTVLDFKNTGPGTCTLYGYPGVSLAGGTPVTQIGLAAAESHVTPRELVTLAPGAVANALLQVVHAGNYPAATCGPVTAAYLQIYPPNQMTPAYLAYTAAACAKPVPLLTVSVVQPGSDG